MSDTVDDFQKIQDQATRLSEWLKSNAPHCAIEQRHLDEGSQERAYWHHGYLSALGDVKNLLTGGR